MHSCVPGTFAYGDAHAFPYEEGHGMKTSFHPWVGRRSGFKTVRIGTSEAVEGAVEP